jgi:hypothetical protein
VQRIAAEAEEQRLTLPLTALGGLVLRERASVGRRLGAAAGFAGMLSIGTGSGSFRVFGAAGQAA